MHTLAKHLIQLSAWMRTTQHKARHSKHRIYLSGAISSIDLQEAYENFARAEHRLKSTYIVVNPLTIHPDNLTWCEYMLRDIWELMFCHTIFMQSNWKSSNGARIERLVAIITFKTVIYE